MISHLRYNVSFFPKPLQDNIKLTCMVYYNTFRSSKAYTHCVIALYLARGFLVTPYAPPRPVQSSKDKLLSVPKTRCASHRDKSFQYWGSYCRMHCLVTSVMQRNCNLVKNKSVFESYINVILKHICTAI